MAQVFQINSFQEKTCYNVKASIGWELFQQKGWWGDIQESAKIHNTHFLIIRRVP